MNDLYHFLKSIEQKTNEEIVESGSISIHEVQQYIGSRFMSENVKKSVYNFHQGTCYQLSNIKICIFGKTNKLKKILDTIRFMLALNKKIHTNHNLHTIVIFLTPLKKKLVESFSPDNVNSGLTNGKYICIFREEEVVKVCIHELIHALDWDLKEDDEIIKDKMSDLLGVSISCKITEAYTEAWAKVLNCFVCSRSLSSFRKNIKDEKVFSLWQMSKIISKAKQKHPKTFTDFLSFVDKETHVFCYYFLSPAMIFDIERWIKFTKKYNKNYMYYSGNPELYSRYIVGSFLDPKFLKSLEDMILLYKKNKGKYSKKTMRMTIVEC